jgi:hypothetical protein
MSLPVAPVLAPWLLLISGSAYDSSASHGPIVLAAFYEHSTCSQAALEFGRRKIRVTYGCMTREDAWRLWPNRRDLLE